MAFQATACNVMIASPDDVLMERNIVREIVHEWNVINAKARKGVLLPVGWETHSAPLQGDRPQALLNKQILRDADLLIAAFWTRLGTPTGDAASGTVEEIQKHIKANKPVLLYFSAAPVAPESLDPAQYDALRHFKEKCSKEGLYKTYHSMHDFRDKVRRDLEITINTDPYFRGLPNIGVSEKLILRNAPGPSLPSLTREASQLLVEAVAGGGDVMVVAWLGGTTVQANGKDFVEPNNPRSRATWEGAVEELVRQGLLEPVGSKGEVFRVTRQGYTVADLLRP